MDSAGEDGGRVQLYQEGQEDVRKAPFQRDKCLSKVVPTTDLRGRETFSVDFTVCKLQTS